MKEICIEGIDGSGKTSVSIELEKLYLNEGLQPRIIAPYRLANNLLGHDLYHLWRSHTSAKLAIKILHQVLEEAKEQALDDAVDVVIYDRHWLTAFTEIGNSKELVSEWKTFVPAALLRVSPLVARRRAINDSSATWSSPEELSRYAQEFGIQAQHNKEKLLGIYRSDDDVSVDLIARSIVWDMNIRR